MKRFGIVALALLALCAFGASMASAEEGILPFKTKSVVVKGKKSELATASLSVICKELTASTITFTSDSHGTGVLKWAKCTSGGLAVESVTGGKKAGKETIEAEVLFLVCLINSAALEFGVAAETDKTVELEVPSTGTKVKIEGQVIGALLVAAGKLTESIPVDFVGSKGKQNITECKDSAGNAKKHTLTAESTLTKAKETASESVEEGVAETKGEKNELMDT
jgi:hypothetical protein